MITGAARIEITSTIAAQTRSCSLRAAVPSAAVGTRETEPVFTAKNSKPPVRA